VIVREANDAESRDLLFAGIVCEAYERQSADTLKQQVPPRAE